MDDASENPSALTTAGNVGADEPNDFQRLVQFIITSAQRFGLAVARVLDPRIQESLVDQAVEAAAAVGKTVRVLDAGGLGEDEDLLEWLRRELVSDAAPPANALFVTKLERFLPSLGPVGAPIQGLNRSRDLLPETIPVPVVLWLSEPASRVLALHAADLADIVLTSFRFGEAPRSPLLHRHQDVPSWYRLASDEEVPRLRREETLLRDFLQTESDSSSAVDAMARLAQIRLGLGDPATSMKWLDQAIGRAEALGDARLSATLLSRRGNQRHLLGELDLALDDYQQARRLLTTADRRISEIDAAKVASGIADILQSRGELDEALRIRKTEELPVYEKLGDVRSRAVTMGQIADILQSRGELDEALQIRKTEELPVYEKLGDVRERAVTMGKIADILQARGELDEALRIRKTEELPVYEKLGDVRSRAVTMGKIADILQARGELDEAEALRRGQLVVFTRLGDRRELLVAQAKLALTLVQRGKPKEHGKEILGLLLSALGAARAMKLPEAGQILGILEQLGVLEKDVEVALKGMRERGGAPSVEPGEPAG